MNKVNDSVTTVNGLLFAMSLFRKIKLFATTIFADKSYPHPCSYKTHIHELFNERILVSLQC